jgi:hypothetical protein
VVRGVLRIVVALVLEVGVHAVREVGEDSRQLAGFVLVLQLVVAPVEALDFVPKLPSFLPRFQMFLPGLLAILATHPDRYCQEHQNQ